MPPPLHVTEPAALLAFLFAALPETKKSQVRQWLQHQAIMVNGRAVTQFDHGLKPGDVVTVRADRFAAPRDVLASGMRVYFEDATLIVIDKPSGLLSIASEAEDEKTAYFQLTDYVRHSRPNSKERVWIVHRLDRETSGLMVFAKTPEAKDTLQGTWDACVKRYDAVIEGRLKVPKGTFESDLDETNPFRVHSAPASETTRHAVTHYREVARRPGRSLVELTLETGRRHQIRVHLADAGCPVIGDKKYGAKTDPAKRLGLHSSFLGFKHPGTGQTMEFTSPLPPNLARLV